MIAKIMTAWSELTLDGTMNTFFGSLFGLFWPEHLLSPCRRCLLLEIWSLSLVLYSLSIFRLHRQVSFFSSTCTAYMHVTSKRVLCNCHEVSKVSFGAIGKNLDGDRRGSHRQFFTTFFQVSFIYDTFAFICWQVGWTTKISFLGGICEEAVTNKTIVFVLCQSY